MESQTEEEVLEEHPAGRVEVTAQEFEHIEVAAFLDRQYSKLCDFIQERFEKQTELITDLRKQIQYAQFTQAQVKKPIYVQRMSSNDTFCEGAPVSKVASSGDVATASYQLRGFTGGLSGAVSAREGQHAAKSSLDVPVPTPRLQREKSRSTSTVLRGSQFSRQASNVSAISGASRISKRVTREQTHKALAILNAKSDSTEGIISPQSEMDDDSQALSCKERAVAFIESDSFGYTVQLVILLNLLLLGLEVEFRSGGNDHGSVFALINLFIVAFFIIEFLLRICTFGFRDYFCGPERLWNALDFIVIVISVFETGLELFIQAMALDPENNSSYLRALRLARLARALRSVRVMRFLRYIAALRTIILSIISTMGPLLWTLAILVMLFYLFAVVLTQMVTDYCRYELGFGSNQECTLADLKYWVSVTESMLTLFKCITGGVSWEEPLEPLRVVSPLAVVTLLLYVVITVLAVLNVVTGVFCHTAIESAKADKDVATMKQMKQHEAQKAAFQQIFREIDNDQSDFMTLNELQAAMSNPKMASLMQSMDISTQDIWTLFMVLDENMDGCVTLDEFVYSCMRMQGPAKGLHLARMSYENSLMREEITRIQTDLKTMERNVKHTIRSSTMDLEHIPKEHSSRAELGPVGHTTDPCFELQDGSKASTIDP